MIFVASSHERISAYRGQSQTSPPAAWRKPSPRRIGGGQVNGYGNRAGIGYPGSCTALMGTAAAAAARSDRGWCEPGVRAADQITPEPPEERRLASST